MKKRETLSNGEKLLEQILEECLEEDLSFVPPEREIARTHRFSAEFEESMKTLLEHSSKNLKEQEIQRHFHPRYAHLAACILIFCVCGGLLWSILVPLSRDFATSAPMEAFDATAESAVEEAAEVEEASEGAMDTEAAADSYAGEGGLEEGEKIWCGQTVRLAERQEVPESLDNVTVLVNCPVLNEENPVLNLTIGNVGEETIRYLNRYALEVWLEDGWYEVPPKTEKEGEWMDLEGGMAMDEEIDLSDYRIDYGAQQYRLVVQVGQDAVSAEFTFEEVFTEKMEKLEGEESSGE